MDSPVTTSGFQQQIFAQAPQMPDPRMFSEVGDAVPQIFNQAVQQQQNMWRFRQEVQDSPIKGEILKNQLAAGSLNLSQPIDTPVGESFKAVKRIGDDGQPITDKDGNALVDWQSIAHVKRTMLNPVTHQVETKDMVLPGKIIATAESQMQARSKVELDAANAAKAQAAADNASSLADTKRMAAEAAVAHQKDMAAWFEEKAKNLQQLADIKQQLADTAKMHEETRAQYEKDRAAMWKSANDAKSVDVNRIILPNGNEAVTYTDRRTGLTLTPPQDLGGKPVYKDSKKGLGDLLKDQNDALMGTGKTPAAAAPAQASAPGKLYSVVGNQIQFAPGADLLKAVNQAVQDSVMDEATARKILEANGYSRKK